eukprot:5466748-Prymnesium_polylepis.2
MEDPPETPGLNLAAWEAGGETTVSLQCPSVSARSRAQSHEPSEARITVRQVTDYVWSLWSAKIIQNGGDHVERRPGRQEQKVLRVRIALSTHRRQLANGSLRHHSLTQGGLLDLEALFESVKENVNPKLSKNELEEKKVLFWQGETTKSKKDLVERPNPRLRHRAD